MNSESYLCFWDLNLKLKASPDLSPDCAATFGCFPLIFASDWTQLPLLALIQIPLSRDDSDISVFRYEQVRKINLFILELLALTKALKISQSQELEARLVYVKVGLFVNHWMDFNFV